MAAAQATKKLGPTTAESFARARMSREAFIPRHIRAHVKLPPIVGENFFDPGIPSLVFLAVWHPCWPLRRSVFTEDECDKNPPFGVFHFGHGCGCTPPSNM
jgi:hypothetical protein